MTSSDVERGRTAYGAQAWADAYRSLSGADRQQPLEAEDLERLAVAAVLVGRNEDAERAWTRAYQAFLDQGDAPRAAWSAFWYAFHLLRHGEGARGRGWLARAQRVVDERDQDCALRGYLLIPGAIQTMHEGRPEEAYATFGRAGKIAARFADLQLSTMARQGQGRSLLRMGRVSEGMALLDEGMVAIIAGEVSPIIAGDLYCSMIAACHEALDMRRAKEWTAALTRWCESQPDVAPHQGICLVHRAQIMQLHGAWAEAATAVQEACDRLAESDQAWATAAAFYQQGELHRLRGDLAAAEESYRQASAWGLDPQPGLALLRTARGQLEPAMASIRRVVADAATPVACAAALPASVEVMLAAGDTAAARSAADQLAAISASFGVDLLKASAAWAQGAVLLAEGDPRASLTALRRALGLWQEVGSPYEMARTRVLLGQAYRALGDEEAAALEFEAARRALEQLGAAPELARLTTLARMDPPKAGGGLTGRELEVLRLVATGKTNRAIAGDLVISEKTVARHVSNIFTKLSLSSRAEAAAHAFRHHLV